MAKKKERKIFNIDEVNIEIDYDKLAEAIVKANERQTQQYSVSREWMKFIIFPVFWGAAIVAGVVALSCFVYGAMNMYSSLEGLSNTALAPIKRFDIAQFATGGFFLCIGFFTGSVSFATAMTAKEIDKEKDRQYVAAMFSNVVALVALIISVIALVKG